MDGGAHPGSSVMDEVRGLNAKNAIAQYERMEQQANRCAAPKQPYEELSVQEQVNKLTDVLVVLKSREVVKRIFFNKL